MKILSLNILLAFCLLAPIARAEKKIFATLPAIGDIFWQTMQKGIEKATQDKGYGLLIRSAQQDRQYTENKNIEISLVNFLIKNGAQQIILAPSPALDKTLEIPKAEYIFAGRSSNTSTLPYKGRVLVAIDDYDAGKKAASLLKNKFPKGTKVGVFYVYLTEDRMKGFIDQAKALGYNVAFKVRLKPGIRENQDEVKLTLEKHPDVKSIFTSNESSTFAVLNETAKLSKQKQPLHVGFDFRKEFVKHLRGGNLYSLIVQDPFLIGYKCAEMAMALQAGQSVPERIKIDTIVVDSQNLDTPEIKDRLKYYLN